MKAFLALTLLSTASARPGPRADTTDTYDYIVVGGGTSGLVVANRLSEDPAVSVLVIEAGDSVLSNTNVSSLGGYGLAFGTEIDYAYPTTPQVYADGASTVLRAGKALGGTSTINGMAYTRAESNQIDAWEALGNKGWNWASLFPYYLKSETFQPPSSIPNPSYTAYNPAYHGTTGPLYIAFPDGETNSTYPQALNSTYAALALPWNADGTGGSMVGFSPYAHTANRELNIRWDAARAYYYPYADRTNLKVLFNTTANKLTWATTTADGADATADGVQVTSADGTLSVLGARKEVILSAGSLVSPLLLELSGVGNPTVLAKHGIATVVDLPTVGENLQDQINNELVYTPPANFTATFDNGNVGFVAYPAASHVFTANATNTAADVKAKLPAYAAAVAAASGNVTSAADLLDFFTMQHELIFGDHEVPYAEVLIYMSGGTWGAQYWGLLPFSRGSVHISQAESTKEALINPNFFMLDYDVELQVSTAKFIREVFATGDFAAVAGVESSPGFEAVPADASDEVWKAWATGGYRSNFHPVATAAMMPREKGGVVDAELRVYGTSNVRVVDASVLPFQVCGHLVSTLYAVAEKAADIIKGVA